MDDTEHTPTPWKAQSIGDSEDELGEVFIIGENLGGLVGAALPLPSELDSGDFTRVEANASLIVHAVNSLASHEARIAELEEALRPFAAHAACFDRPDEQNAYSISAVSTLPSGDRSKITIGDLRAARRALHTEGE